MITIDFYLKFIKLEKKPVIHVHTTNHASQNLLKSIGFTKGEKVFFGRIQFEESSE